LSDHERGRGARFGPVLIPTDGPALAGDLTVPAGATGVVLFAHGSGSSRKSPRNRLVARAIQDSGAATLLFDLLSSAEERADAFDGRLRFDIALLSRRLAHAVRWIENAPETRRLGIGLFAADLGPLVQAVVSRGGRPDLAGEALARVGCPTLLIVGERDEFVLQLNRECCARLRCENRLEVVPGATHLFGEPGALEQVASLAAEWFRRHLRPA
jgi:pimeloyl-ACP methyl ester carboxylesterase